MGHFSSAHFGSFHYQSRFWRPEEEAVVIPAPPPVTREPFWSGGGGDGVAPPVYREPKTKTVSVRPKQPKPLSPVLFVSALQVEKEGAAEVPPAILLQKSFAQLPVAAPPKEAVPSPPAVVNDTSPGSLGELTALLTAQVVVDQPAVLSAVLSAAESVLAAGFSVRGTYAEEPVKVQAALAAVTASAYFDVQGVRKEELMKFEVKDLGTFSLQDVGEFSIDDEEE